MSPNVHRLLTDWEFWHAVTMVSLVIWILARTNRYWLIDFVQRLAWGMHGTVPLVPQAELDQVRPVVEVFAGTWLPLAIGSFVCGFFAFHADAEARRAEDDRA